LPSAATLGQRKNRIQPRKGLRPTAQGCRPRLPWDNARIESNPERGCVPQPRVAVRGYPGTTQESNPTPKGLRPTAQGCRPRLPWDNARIESNPEGVAEDVQALCGLRRLLQPRWGCFIFDHPPGVAAD